MSINTPTTRPGVAPVDSSPRTAAPSVAIVWILGLLFAGVVGLVVGLIQVIRATQRGYKTGRYWLAALVPTAIYLVVFVAWLILIVGVASTAAQPAVTPASVASVAPPSQVAVTSIPAKSDTGYIYAQPGDSFDNSACPDKLPPQVRYEENTNFDPRDLTFIVKSELAVLNDAITTRNVACAALLGRSPSSLNFAPFTSGAKLVIDSVEVGSKNAMKAYPVTVDYHMTDGSTRPFVDDGTKSMHLVMSMRQTTINGDQIWVIS